MLQTHSETSFSTEAEQSTAQLDETGKGKGWQTTHFKGST